MIGNPILLLLVVGPMAAAVIGYLIGRVNKSPDDYFCRCSNNPHFSGNGLFLPDI